MYHRILRQTLDSLRRIILRSKTFTRTRLEGSIRKAARWDVNMRFDWIDVIVVRESFPRSYSKEHSQDNALVRSGDFM